MQKSKNVTCYMICTLYDIHNTSEQQAQQGSEYLTYVKVSLQFYISFVPVITLLLI